MRPIDADEVIEKINRGRRLYGDSKCMDWDGLEYFINKFSTLDIAPPFRVQPVYSGGNYDCPICGYPAMRISGRLKKYCDECGSEFYLSEENNEKD